MSKRPVDDRLARVVAPEALHQLILSRGLEACGEIVTSATPAQLTSLLDLDLWHHARPGHDEQFDVDRFGEWLETLADAGESVAARTVAALDTDLVIAGLSRYVRVFDPGIFEPTAQSDDEPFDRAEAMREGGGDGLECEIGGYLVRGRRADAWDAIVTLLAALDAGHGPCFHAVMEGCRRLSNSTPEIDGLDDLLQAPEQHLHEVAIERERRRSELGYATPADARAFLQMARQRQPARSPAAATGLIGVHPIALTSLRRLMTRVRDTHESVLLTRSRELAFLANTLLAGCSVQSRSFTPREASDAAAAICNLGLEYWPDALPDSWLIEHDLVTAFETGWSVLHREVSLFAADALISTLGDLDCGDRDLRLELAALRRTLVEQRDAGTPWRARDAAGTLAMLDMTASVGVLGLLEECPVVPAALMAVLEGRATAVSPTAFDFIATAAQIGAVHRFMRKLPAVLSR